MLMQRTAAGAAFLLLHLTGCGFDRPGVVWTASTDTLASGAVRVVHEPPSSGIEPTWVMEEEVRIGALDGDGPDSFGQIKGLVVDAEGRIIVLDAQAQELRVFGPDGAHLRTLGRRGEGPGELRNANGIMLASDGRVWVVDPQLGRMSVFDVEAGFETSYRWDVRQWGWVWGGVLTGDGRVLVPSNAQWGGERWQALLVYDQQMELLDSIPVERLPGMDADYASAFRWEAGGMRGFIPVPFAAQPQRVLTGGPGYWLTADGDPAYRISHWGVGGDTTLVVETRRPPIPVTAAERDSAMAHVREFLRERGSETRPDWSKIPDVRPAVLGLFISGEGDIWVEVATPERDATTWDVYAADGRYRGTAVTPLRPYRWVPPVIRGDRFWALVTDELDVQYVVAGRIRSADGPG
jgi:hypothetical protein